uniref:TonB family protein n=1 Tax=Pedobacter schmidteae TaxID=2201271 RepID=UPI000EB2E07A|nr:TonB family protein [Pedobacter schmidteae]
MSWAHYILQVNIYLLVFYGFYKLLLDKETYFTLNRIYLVLAGLLSLTIPFLRFEWFTKQEVIQPVYVSVGQLMGQVSIVEEAPDGLNPGNLIVLAYLIGISFFSVRFIFRLLSVRRKLKQKEAGTAFSFFLKKRIDNDLPQLPTIHKHEDTHIRQWHSADVLFFELLAVFTWFNPVIYFYKNAVKSIHEYIADEEASKFQGDKEQYSLLLLSSAFGVPVHTLTNSFFNKSLIKKRIFMLHKQRSPKMAALKYGLFIPLFATALILSSATIRSNEKIQEIADNLPLNSPIETVKEVMQESIKPIVPQVLKKTETIKEASEQTPAGWDDFYKFIRMTLRYPAAALENKTQGTTMIKFSVTGGQIEDVGIATKLANDCDAEALRSVALYPDYKSIKDGKYTIQIAFLLGETTTKLPVLNEKIAPLKGYTALNKITVTGYRGVVKPGNNAYEESKIHDFVSTETQPSFPGGMDKFYLYLKQSIRYPKEAQEKKIQGKVFLSYIVEKNGELSGIRVERKLGAGTDEEAVRVLQESPKWIPGTIGGKPVRVKYNIPISFTLTPAPGLPISPQDQKGSVQPEGKHMGMSFSNGNGNVITLRSSQQGQPLYVLDGMPISDVEMKTVDPNNIEAVNVIKDAKATALYGIKGANGVILITTKSGKGLGKPTETKSEN